jgi:hypothetical protein
MKHKPTGPNYRVTLRPLPNRQAPPIIRLRQFLKAALRSYGFQAVAVEELPAPGRTTSGGHDHA